MAREFAEAFYHSKAWKKTRRAYINSVNGMCEKCMRQGHYIPGYIVHHKKEITPSNIHDPSITLDWDNLEYLCTTCHQILHASKNGNAALGLRFNERGELIEVAPRSR